MIPRKNSLDIVNSFFRKVGDWQIPYPKMADAGGGGGGVF